MKYCFVRRYLDLLFLGTCAWSYQQQKQLSLNKYESSEWVYDINDNNRAIIWNSHEIQICDTRRK